MLTVFNPDSALLRTCPFLVICEIGEGEAVKRTGNISPNDQLMGYTLAGTLFASPTIGAHEVNVINAIIDTLSVGTNWVEDDAKNVPLDCHIHFTDQGVNVVVRVFALHGIELGEDIPAELQELEKE